MKDAPASAGGARRRIDWRLAAHLLAHGTSLNDVAARLGCAASTLRRRLRSDPTFRAEASAGAEPAADLPDHLRLQALRRQLHRAIEDEVRQGNVRVILWLADRMKLIEPDRSQTPDDELGQLIGQMSPEELVQFEALRDPQ